jgi:bis(5'-nucleosyl)-tetraphosphatase (symmetrical)
MALYAIGDIQGCDRELGELLDALEFSRTRDRLWFVGDLVNRGPDSLATLRRIRALGDAAVVTLGNHDLHLLAVAFGAARLRGGDTLDAVLRAPDRAAILDWLLTRPVMHRDPALGMALLHAGLSPQWDIATAAGCARELEHALARDPAHVLGSLYGDQPDLWDPALEGPERLRFIANCFTRLRFIDAAGRLVLKAKGAPSKGSQAALLPWFEAERAPWRGTRIVFGHWSTLGLHRSADVIALDTGCVWGGSLTALRLDAARAEPVAVRCAAKAAAEG